MQDLTPKGFLDAMVMGAAGVGIASGFLVVCAANAEEAPAEVTYDNEWSGSGSVDGSWTATPAELAAVGGSNMPLDEINRRRKLYVDAQTVYTCSDGTVIPEVYVKARALLNTYGHGVGGDLADTVFTAIMTELTEDQAQAYLDMPRGRQFTALELSQESGRSLEECERYCEEISKAGWISRAEGSRGTLYGQIAFLYGIEENHTPQFHADPPYAGAFTGTYAADGTRIAYYEGGTPFFCTVPVSKDVVKDGALDPLDDLDALLDTKNKFAVSPCACRTLGIVNGEGVQIPGYPDDYDLEGVVSPACGHPIETCLVLGEEAEFWINNKVGREITHDEAKQLLRNSVDQGAYSPAHPHQGGREHLQLPRRLLRHPVAVEDV